MLSEKHSIRDTLAQPGVHEKEILHYFSSNAFFRGPEPVFEKPLTVMAFTNRCGSNLLADYLNQTAKIGGFNESLNHDTIRRTAEREGINSLPDYISYVFGRFSKDGRFGIKASWDQITMLSRSGILNMFPSVNIIHIKRSDVVSQAVSHWIAHQTRRWTSSQKGDAITPSYDFKSIDKIISSINQANSLIPLVSKTIGDSFTEALYEDVVRDPYGCVNNIGKSISLDLSDWSPNSPKITRQADSTNIMFCQNFISELRSVMVKL
ncbi:Stf0 family sulfotransferase [Paracoccus sp. S4493]|uniref:Stf0 family sulfotransferase n=1 Tax=Paracoccus sp. S4493 TaxID=579490 RepID=UPI0009FBBDA2|nr:Stf0 family sulfotransferase [Paracoccus sp. S4493]